MKIPFLITIVVVALGILLMRVTSPSRREEMYGIDPTFEQMRLSGEWLRAGQNDKAIEACQKALQIDPELSSAHYRLAQIFRKQGQWKRVEDEYRTIIRQYVTVPDKTGSALAHYELGALLSVRGDREAARAEWKLAITTSRALVPQHVGAYQARSKAEQALFASR